MKKIKPEVIGFNMVFNSGRMGSCVYCQSEMDCAALIAHHFKSMIHPNGKPKFRPVYKKQNSPN